MVTKNVNSNNFRSSLGIKNQYDKNSVFKSPDQWLEDKKKFDGAEGLWRIHDRLYDLTNFIDIHPGGQFWLNVSKGLDITEAFESYHISKKPEKMLKQFFVRKAVTPRNSPFTFKEDGFYKTLKRNVREVWDDIPKNGIQRSKYIIDTLLISSIILVVLATKFSNYFIAIIAGILLSLVNTSAHNYYHQKDTFRNCYGYLGMSAARDWKIIHVFSHHFHPNSVLDIQVYLVQPFLQFYPHKKSITLKYLSYIYGPIFVWPLLFIYTYINKIYYWVVIGRTNHISKLDLLPCVIPTLTYLITNQPLLLVLKMWLFVILVAGFCFTFVGITTTHYHPNIFIDGDKPRSEDEMDWGINQLDTVGDRVEIQGSHFFGMVLFGDHAIHHLFPSLDHGLLEHLYPVVEKTLQQFNLSIRVSSSLDMIRGYFLLLSKEVGAKTKKAYYLLQVMQRTVPYINALGLPEENLPKPLQEEESEQFLNSEDILLVTPTPASLPLPTSTPPPLSPLPSTPTQKQSGQSLSKRSRKLKNDAVEKTLIGYVKNARTELSHVRHMQEPKAEALKMLLLSMLPDLRKMYDGGVRTFKHKALETVDSIF
ncbi:hypothetical protein RN001_007426 [Aquatica leii]|uniref:Cytochrome b5 heme-binding domain-containing protein n=1 Tax=Aquatica leii TaxID=1421715 RepID=A0AAN7P2U5_9COLE|nr:hypothetical protein RN001_007426 [Aquatica leii]